jgi:hypothetical protein
MIATYTEYKATIARVRKELQTVSNMHLLNSEGERALTALHTLENSLEFHDNIQEFANDDIVNACLEAYSDCQLIRNIRGFLETQK